jgi:hypothetical protein
MRIYVLTSHTGLKLVFGTWVVQHVRKFIAVSAIFTMVWIRVNSTKEGCNMSKSPLWSRMIWTCGDIPVIIDALSSALG